MERVTGIGGVFFRVRDPERMAKWYSEHLGINAPDGHADFPWQTGPSSVPDARTVWAIFPSDTDYFGPTRPAFMISYRVADLDRMVKQLRGAGIVVDDIVPYDYGRFAWTTDPEGNRIELWEPKEAS